jgi:hypothetical protein
MRCTLNSPSPIPRSSPMVRYPWPRLPGKDISDKRRPFANGVQAI